MDYLNKKKDFTVLRGENLSELENLTPEFIVINAIGKGMQSDGIQDFKAIQEANIRIPLNIARQCSRLKLRFIQLGSFPADFLDTESIYYESKRTCSTKLQEVIHSELLTILSPDIVIGHDNRSLLGRWHEKLRTNESIVLNKPNLIRNFVTVEDLADAVIKVAQGKENGIVKPVLSNYYFTMKGFYSLIQNEFNKIRDYKITFSDVPNFYQEAVESRINLGEYRSIPELISAYVDSERVRLNVLPRIPE